MTEKDAGRAMAATKKMKKEEKKKADGWISRHARTASPPCVPSPLELKVADRWCSPRTALLLAFVLFHLHSIRFGRLSPRSGHAELDSVTWSTIRSPGARFGHLRS